MNVEYAYYQDGLVPDLVCRLTVKDNEMVAEMWDFSLGEWVPTGDAWETIEDQRNNWNLGSEAGAMAAIREVLKQFPDAAQKMKVKRNESAAIRKRT